MPYFSALKFHLILVSSLMILLLPGLAFLKINDQLLDSYFAKDDPRYLRLLEIQDEFKAVDPIIIGIDIKKDLSDQGFIKALEEFTDKAQKLDQGLSIHSILSLPHVAVDAGNISIKPLIEAYQELSEDESNPSTMQQKWQFFIGQDGRETIVFIQHSQSNKDQLKKLLKQLEGLTKEYQEHFNAHIFGLTAIQVTIFDTIVSTLRYVAPASALVILTLLLLLTRSLIFSLVPMMIVIISIALGFGISGYLGFSITGVSMGIPQIILAIGICDCMHIYFSYRRLLREGASLDDARRQAIQLNIKPTFLTTMTTALAFASFTVSDIKATREFGIICAIATLMVWYLSLVLLDLLFSLRSKKMVFKKPQSPLNRKFLAFLQQKKLAILLGAALVAGSGLILIPQLKVGSDFHQAFPEDAKISRSIQFFADNFSYINMRSYYLSCAAAGCVHQAGFLNALRGFVAKVHEVDGVISSRSILDVYAIADDLSPLPAEDQKFQQEQIDELNAILSFQHPSKNPLNSLVNVSQSATKLDIYLDSGNLQDGQKLEKKLFHLADQHGLVIQASDFQSLLADIEARIIPQLRLSMLMTLVSIIFVLMIVFRTPSLVMVALLPNAIALLSLVNIFYLFDISITTNTMIVWCVGLGVAVDDTIHFLYHYQKARQKDEARYTAVSTAFNHSGQAILSTSIILAVGFGTSIFGDYLPGIHAGLLLMASVLLALLADLICLPALILVLGKKVKL
ncbi:MAG: efflux RND transporter permease subunit [Oligoflexus sp.]